MFRKTVCTRKQLITQFVVEVGIVVLGEGEWGDDSGSGGVLELFPLAR